MATSSTLEDQVTCSVCLGIYNDPHVLTKCLHTYCLKCVDQIEQLGAVYCPECRVITEREDVRKDFKMQGIIDAMKQQQDLPKSSASCSKTCAMCHDGVKKPVCFQCKECDHFMCMDCNRVHNSMKTCKDHDVNSITEILRRLQVHKNTLREVTDRCEYVKNTIDKESNIIDDAIDQIKNGELEQINAVRKYTDEAMRELQENQKRLEEVIQQVNSHFLIKLESNKEKLKKGKEEIQGKCEVLETLINTDDVDMTKETIDHVKLQVSNSVHELAKGLPFGKSNIKSSVNVTKGENWSPKGCVIVNHGQVFQKQKLEKPVVQAFYSHLVHGKYKKIASYILSCYPKMLCKVKNDIWCCGGESLVVYDQNCKELKRIPHPDKIRQIRGISCTYIHQIIIASSHDGLHELDITGQYQNQLAKGSFSDVYSYGCHVYAFEYTKCEIMKFQYNYNKWEMVHAIRPHLNIGSEFDKLCVYNEGFYLSSEHTNVVYAYDTNGSYLDGFTREGSNLHVCDVDDMGNLLLTDFNKHQLLLYDTHTRSCHQIDVDVELNGPVHALVDNFSKIWVVEYNSGRLVKLEKDRSSDKELED